MIHKKNAQASSMELEGFECLRALGRGGFAVTYLFRDIKGEFGEHVAVKVPHDKEREEPLIRGDILSLASLRDIPFIVQILDIRTMGDRYVLLMEFVEGPRLRDLLGAVGSGRPLSLDKAVLYAAHVAQGLAAAHEKHMVHRDIKPENIIIEKNTDTAKILDFGIASAVGRKGYFETSLGRHTPYYSPGEVLFERKGDHRVDVYALGMTLYEMTTGTLPFYEEDATFYRIIDLMRHGTVRPPKAVNPQIPMHLDRVIMKAIAKDMEDRFKDMGEFIHALEPPAELRLAQDHLASGSVRRAEQVLRSLVERCPQDSRGHMALALLLNRRHQSQEARTLLEQALALDPEDPVLHMRMGVTLNQLGLKEEARDFLAKALDLKPDRPLRRKIESLLRTVFGVASA